MPSCPDPRTRSPKGQASIRMLAGKKIWRRRQLPLKDIAPSCGETKWGVLLSKKINKTIKQISGMSGSCFSSHDVCQIDIWIISWRDLVYQFLFQCILWFLLPITSCNDFGSNNREKPEDFPKTLPPSEVGLDSWGNANGVLGPGKNGGTMVDCFQARFVNRWWQLKYPVIFTPKIGEMIQLIFFKGVEPTN